MHSAKGNKKSDNLLEATIKTPCEKTKIRSLQASSILKAIKYVNEEGRLANPSWKRVLAVLDIPVAISDLLPAIIEEGRCDAYYLISEGNRYR